MKFLGNFTPGGNIHRNFALLGVKFLGISPPWKRGGANFLGGRISCDTGKMRNLKLQYGGGGLCLLRQVKYALRANGKCLKVILTWWMENFSDLYCCTKFQKICSSPSSSKRRTYFHIFSKISFVHVYFMYLLNLHTTPKGHLIKIGKFLQKNHSY